MRSPPRLAVVALLFVLACSEPVEVPVIDVSEMEPAVAAQVRAARDAVVARPEEAAAWGELAMSLHVHGEPVLARLCYGAAGRRDPTAFRWAYFAALVLLDTDPEAALSELERAVQLRPEDAPARLRAARVLHGLGRGDEARAHYEAVLERDPAHAEALVGLGALAVERGRPEEALGHLRRAVAEAPGSARAQGAYAQLLSRLGQVQAAEEAARVRARLPDVPFPWPDPERDRLYERAVSTSALHARAANRLADGRPDEAAALLTRALGTRPGDVALRAALGAARLAQGRLVEAAVELETALDSSPEDALVHLTLGVVRARQSRFDDALRHFSTARRLDPDDPDVHDNIGLTYERIGRPEDARRSWEEGRRRFPDEPRFAARLGLPVPGGAPPPGDAPSDG